MVLPVITGIGENFKLLKRDVIKILALFCRRGVELRNEGWEGMTGGGGSGGWE